ncbi:unnamed protein product [Lymnaea stagnalis]|uniref:Josephin-2 n=1 Tax=Lymnaea stagnalis TaxID=6523 RepID=A0AAV2IDR8_LYMST
MCEKDDQEEKKLYHERQVKELCALHALNNLLQTKQAFTKRDLDDICNRLSPGSFINPHRSMLGLGNYDVNVLMAALQEKGYETIWFDKRKEVEVLVTDNIMGFILNTPTDYKLGFVKLPIHRKHWIAIRWLDGQYMNLDSKLEAPLAIGDKFSLLEYLRSELKDGEKELLLVVEQNVYENSSWRRDSECFVRDQSRNRKEEMFSNCHTAKCHNGTSSVMKSENDSSIRGSKVENGNVICDDMDIQESTKKLKAS